MLDFNGIDDHVNLGTVLLKPSSEITAEAWIYVSALGGMPTFLGNTQASGHALSMQAGDLKGLVRRKGTYAVVSTPAATTLFQSFFVEAVKIKRGTTGSPFLLQSIGLN